MALPAAMAAVPMHVHHSGSWLRANAAVVEPLRKPPLRNGLRRLALTTPAASQVGGTAARAAGERA